MILIFNLQLLILWSIFFYTSPFIVFILYRRGYFATDSIATFAKIAIAIALIVLIALCVRSYGRSQSQPYTRFAQIYQEVKENLGKPNVRDQLQMFDFDFDYWPVDFDVHDISEG